ncbi:hypothetical protein ACH5RR_021679 [Cinchona calisaya]|uniref:Uncharacterized protein n=1 Tax=Cinchona calisaya TaxID=153742 RepID=A0ABD2ZLJ2_9GENT
MARSLAIRRISPKIEVYDEFILHKNDSTSSGRVAYLNKPSTKSVNQFHEATSGEPKTDPVKDSEGHQKKVPYEILNATNGEILEVLAKLSGTLKVVMENKKEHVAMEERITSLEKKVEAQNNKLRSIRLGK